MEKQHTRRVESFIPLLTIVVVGVSIVASLSPELLSRMRYDRVAILHGELWRIFTAHTVHFSTNHLFYDLSTFAVLGWLIEGRERRCDYGILLFVMALCIGGGLLLFKPDMSYYGGLSGPACGLFVYFALSELETSPTWRLFWGTVICLLIAKIVFEAYTRRSLFYSSEAAIVMWESHAIGSFVAFVTFFVRKKYTSSANASFRGC